MSPNKCYRGHELVDSKKRARNSCVKEKPCRLSDIFNILNCCIFTLIKEIILNYDWNIPLLIMS